MLKSLILRLKGDVVGALLNDRNNAVSVFIKAKDALAKVVAGLEDRMAKIDEAQAKLNAERESAFVASQAVRSQLEKLDLF